jgi:arginine N-succinyltransferase
MQVIMPRDELYLFVLEELETQRIVGVSGILASVGCDEPFYAFDRESVHCDQSLDILKLLITRFGPTEIGSLYLHPEYRSQGLGRFLSLSRFLFMAEHPNRFKKTVIAEMRGWSNSEGCSPFWDHVGSHFFKMKFDQADQLSGINKQFIAELIPRYPIYISLLPSEIQEVVGQTHPNTVPAVKLLQSEGFEKTSAVDIFDAGPKVSCFLTQIRIIKEQCQAMNWQYDDIVDGQPVFVSVGRLHEFKVYRSIAQHGSDKLMLPNIMKSLLEEETWIRWVSVKGFPYVTSNQNKGSFIRRFSQWYHQLSTSLVANLKKR